jgi:hypothetical protein
VTDGGRPAAAVTFSVGASHRKGARVTSRDCEIRAVARDGRLPLRVAPRRREDVSRVTHTPEGASPMKYVKLFALLGLVALGACDDDDGSGPAPEGRVRVVQGIANVATADVLLDGTAIKEDLAFKAAEGYRAVGTGARAVKVRKADAVADIVTVNQAVQAGRDYTIIAYGSEAQGKSIALTDDNTAPAANKAELRVVHAASGQANVDVYVVKNAGDLANAAAKATNLAAGSATAYLEVDADTYLVILTGVGNKTALLTVQNVDLTNGKIRTVVALEKAGGGLPLEGIKLDDR